MSNKRKQLEKSSPAPDEERITNYRIFLVKVPLINSPDLRGKLERILKCDDMPQPCEVFDALELCERCGGTGQSSDPNISYQCYICRGKGTVAQDIYLCR